MINSKNREGSNSSHQPISMEPGRTNSDDDFIAISRSSRARPTAPILTGAKFIALSCVLGLLGCTSASPPDTRAVDEAAIRKMDAEWVTAAQTKQVEAWVEFYSEDAAVLPPNEKLAKTKDDIRKSVGGLLGLPGLSITWNPTKIEVARAGDLGYMYGAYEISWNEANGKRASDIGKNLEIWKKQPDGTWKCIVDTWNSDVPAAPAPSPR
jgi:ketosteroid isomerase-like protein